MKNIVLVGFMGTGKTEVAKETAKAMGMDYVSIDELIVERENREIKSIFKNEGEAHFRELEKNIVKEISDKRDQVIDTGGGVVIYPENVLMLKKNGIVICLWASPDIIYKRTRYSSHRPLLNVEDPKARITELLNQRREYYERADVHINTDDMDIRSIVDRIREIVNEEKK